MENFPELEPLGIRTLEFLKEQIVFALSKKKMEEEASLIAGSTWMETEDLSIVQLVTDFLRSGFHEENYEYVEYYHKVPKTWVDAFWDRVIPEKRWKLRNRWIKYKKLPAQTVTNTKICNICPHFGMDGRDHLRFLTGDPWKTHRQINLMTTLIKEPMLSVDLREIVEYVQSATMYDEEHWKKLGELIAEMIVSAIPKEKPKKKGR